MLKTQTDHPKGRPASQKARNHRPELFYLCQIACPYFKRISCDKWDGKEPGKEMP
jgi:hypothetical protein